MVDVILFFKFFWKYIANLILQHVQKIAGPIAYY